jgi:hypothetical protein
MPSETTTIRHGQLTVTTTPTYIATGLVGPSWLQLHAPQNGNSIYVGGTSVSATNGLMLEKGAVIEIWVPEAIGIYAIVATGSETLYWLITGGN